LVIISVEKVPKKLLEGYASVDGTIPNGVTLTPKETDGFRKLELLVQEKMSQYKTRLVMAHELYHCFQFLTGCAMDEQATNEIDAIMVAGLREKRKVKK
jgi:uncharacterized protein YjaZ